MPINLPERVQHTLHFCLYTKSPAGDLVAFEYVPEDPSWLLVFSHTLDLEVPQVAHAELAQRFNQNIEASIEKINAAAGAKINELRDTQAKFLALEN